MKNWRNLPVVTGTVEIVDFIIENWAIFINVQQISAAVYSILFINYH